MLLQGATRDDKTKQQQKLGSARAAVRALHMRGERGAGGARVADATHKLSNASKLPADNLAAHREEGGTHTHTRSFRPTNHIKPPPCCRSRRGRRRRSHPRRRWRWSTRVSYTLAAPWRPPFTTPLLLESSGAVLRRESGWRTLLESSCGGSPAGEGPAPRVFVANPLRVS